MLPEKAWIPHTTHHPIPRLDHGPLETVECVIIHINDGTTTGTLNWWARSGHEPDGAHIQVSKNGKRFQTMALDRECWHCPPVNRRTVGFEHEGWSRAELAHKNDSRPHVQMKASADACSWVLHECMLGRPSVGHNIKPHSAYSAGGHPNCPGPWDWDLYEELCMKAYLIHWGR